MDYVQLKTMARNSLEYAFISGASLWRDATKTLPVAQCAADVSAMKLNSSGCRRFVQESNKAQLQWNLEEQFARFESSR